MTSLWVEHAGGPDVRKGLYAFTKGTNKSMSDSKRKEASLELTDQLDAPSEFRAPCFW